MQARKQQTAAPGYDWTLVWAVVLLSGIGLVMVYSASSAVALRRFGDEAFYFKRQLMFLLAGGMVMIVLKNVPYTWYRKLAYPLLGLAVVLLVALLVPGVGFSAGGATRWFRLGPFSFQPSEFARLAVVVYLAYSMAKKGEGMEDFPIGILPHLLFTGVVAGLMLFQPDFGSAVILGLLVVGMLFVGGARPRHLGLTAAAATPFLVGFLVMEDYRLQRLLSFMSPEVSRFHGGYQSWHAKLAFGSGGVSGVGVGAGMQKLFYLPEPHTDFVFAVLGEEMGLWGVLLVLVLYCLILWRGLIMARKVEDLFGAYLATGIVLSLGIPTVTNICVTMGLLPTKGLTLPFLSYGGTSLVMCMAQVGVLQSIAARHAPELAPPKRNVRVKRREPWPETA